MCPDDERTLADDPFVQAPEPVPIRVDREALDEPRGGREEDRDGAHVGVPLEREVLAQLQLPVDPASSCARATTDKMPRSTYRARFGSSRPGYPPRRSIPALRAIPEVGGRERTSRVPRGGEILECAFGGELVSTGTVPTREKRAEASEPRKTLGCNLCRQHGKSLVT